MFLIFWGCYKKISWPIHRYLLYVWKIMYQNFAYRYHTSMFILFMISALLNAFLAKDFFNESLESAHFLVTGLHLFSKFMTMMRREREYLNLLQDIRKCWNGFITNNPKHKEYMLRASTRADRTTIIIFSSICNVLTVNMLNSLVKNMIEPEKMHFPVQVTTWSYNKPLGVVV